MDLVKARAIIVEGNGTQFDPAAVDAFGKVSDDDLRRIAEEIR
jgi:response regulator RpfG family c-di-GMP phosphodiesterase